MNSAYEEFPSESQSPYNLGRGAHPGAVLLSPQSSAMNLSNSVASAVVLSPQMNSQPHSMFLNELLDQQSLLLDAQQQVQVQQPVQQTSTHSAAGSAVMSPMVQSPTRTPANISGSSMFLDSFTRQSSNTFLGMHTRSHSANKPQSQPQNQQQPQQQSEPNTVVNFTQDINQLCSWTSMLSSAQQNTVMDNLLSTLNEDVLQYTKLKLDSLMNSGYLSPQIPAIASPVPNRENYPITNLDSVFFSEKDKENDKDNNHIDSRIDNSIIYQQWSPQPTSMTQPIYDYIKDMHQRPKSADPHVSQANSNQKAKRAQANFNSNLHTHSSYSNHNNYYSSKGRQGNMEFENGNANNSTNGHSYYGNRQQSIPNNALSPEISPNSSSNVHVGTTASPPVSAVGANGNGSSMNPRTLTDPRLLTNIPSWLKSLRLHKYSEALGAKKWDELIYLDDDTLEKMGISALGARRKLLKAFAIVRDYKEHGLIDQTAYIQ